MKELQNRIRARNFDIARIASNMALMEAVMQKVLNDFKAQVEQHKTQNGNRKICVPILELTNGRFKQPPQTGTSGPCVAQRRHDNQAVRGARRT